jgi:hypothetical protein
LPYLFPFFFFYSGFGKPTADSLDRRNDSPAATPPNAPGGGGEPNRTVADSTSGAGDDENFVEVNRYPAGIRCTRVGYYTIPTAEELEKLVDPNGKCIVDGFTVGRSGYGSVYFPDTFDVSGLDIDEIGEKRIEIFGTCLNFSRGPWTMDTKMGNHYQIDGKTWCQ